MKLIISILFLAASLNGQISGNAKLSGKASVYGAGLVAPPTPPSFVHAVSGDTASSFVVATSAMATTAHNLLFAFWGAAATCASMNGANQLSRKPTNSGADDFIPILPVQSFGAYILGTNVLNQGSGYTSPICTVVPALGDSGAATCTATQTGGAIDGVVIGTTSSLFGAPATIAITDGGPGTGATAEIVAYGIQPSSSPAQCVAMWYAKDIHGNGADQVIYFPGHTYTFMGMVAMEFAGMSTTAPLDDSSAGTSHSFIVATIGYGSGQAHEISACGTRVESTSDTLTFATTGYVIPSGAVSPLTFTVGGYKADFDPTSTNVTVSGVASVNREILCASFKQ